MEARRETPAPNEPRWHRRKAARPAEILEAALAEFVERGYSTARLEDIARRAGCTKGTIFLYFANKQELFKGVVRTNVVPRIAQVEQLIAEHRGTMRELLEKVLRMRWRALHENHLSGLPKLMFSEAGNFPELAQFFHDEVMARSQATIEGVLRRGIAAGEFRPVDVACAAKAAVTPIVMAALWKHSFQKCTPDLDPQAFFETSLELLLRGLTPDGATEGGA